MTHRLKKSTIGILMGIHASLALVACGGGTSGGSSGSSNSAGLDPLVEDFGIAYVRQAVPEMDDADIREVINFTPGADLIYRDLAAPGANSRNITSLVTGGMGDVRDVEASFDGTRLLFSLRMPEIEGADPEDQPTWNIWEYEIATDTLRRIIVSDITSEAGQDIDPHYLPDDRIIFSSTRQRTQRATLLDEGKPQFAAQDEDGNEPALVLHVMNADGTDIHQISFNQSHDLDPVVLESGKVVFSRWDNAGSNNDIHLYSMNPDGSNLRLLYGANSHDTGTDGAIVQFVEPREMPDGRVAVLLKPFTGNYQGADIVAIEVDDYIENTQPTLVNQGVLAGPAQESIAFNEIRTDLLPSPGGRFNSFYPLWDGTDRALITWSQCRLLNNNRIGPCTEDALSDPDAVEAPPLYGVYIYDMRQQTQLPIFTPQEGILYRDVVSTQPRTLPEIFFDQAGPITESYDFDPSLVDENTGILNIRSVYDLDGNYDPLGGTAPDIGTLADPGLTITADDRPARFLRIVKPVSLPDDDLVDLNGNDFGVGGQRVMREIIGYAPIEPDGSVRVKVPADIPFAISILDKDGRRIGAMHQNWLQVRPGEILTCNGCHDPATGLSHGRSRETFAQLNDGATADGVNFPNTMSTLVTNGLAFLINSGNTMAEARGNTDPGTLEPSVDLRFLDIWTDPDPAQANRAPDAPFDYLYDTLYPITDPDKDTKTPVSQACQNNWNPLCRVVIHYEQHIHPLWSIDRGADGNLDGVGDDTCIVCHTTTDAAGADMVAEGQLDLTDGPSTQTDDHFKSYRELFSGDNAEELDMGGNLIDEQALDPITGLPLFQLDANGDPDPTRPIFVRAPGPSMRTAGALASSRFFNRFADAGNADHFGIMTGAELKLISEWLDIGARYYNDPFAVPP